MPVPQRHSFREKRSRAPGVSHLGADHQRRRHGHAQVEAAARAAHDGHQEQAEDPDSRRRSIQRGRERQRLLGQLWVRWPRKRSRHEGTTAAAKSTACSEA